MRHPICVCSHLPAHTTVLSYRYIEKNFMDEQARSCSSLRCPSKRTRPKIAESKITRTYATNRLNWYNNWNWNNDNNLINNWTTKTIGITLCRVPAHIHPRVMGRKSLDVLQASHLLKIESSLLVAVKPERFELKSRMYFPAWPHMARTHK